jgi:hypothetical protein
MLQDYQPSNLLVGRVCGHTHGFGRWGTERLTPQGVTCDKGPRPVTRLTAGDGVGMLIPPGHLHRDTAKLLSCPWGRDPWGTP